MDSEPENEDERKLSFCSNCQQPIGWVPKSDGIEEQHGMVIRDGHYRIFKDANHKKKKWKNMVIIIKIYLICF